MNKFLSSKLFVVLSTSLTLLFGAITGWLLGYQPQVRGYVYGGGLGGTTSTSYVFNLRTAFGYWLLAIVLTYVVFLVSLLIRNIYMNKTTAEENR